MSIIRNHVEKRSIFAILLITLLCITTIAYAALWIVLLWGIVSGVGTIITYLTLLRPLIQSLDEQITSLDNDIHKLNLKYTQADNDHTSYKSKQNQHEEALTEREEELAAATSAKATATQRVSDTNSNYLSAKAISDSAHRYFINHNGSCDYCEESSCSAGTRLYNLWQSKLAETKEYKKAYDAAQLELQISESKIKSATFNIKIETKWIRIWKNRADRADAQRTEIDAELTDKKRTLKSKRGERDGKNLERQTLDAEVSAKRKALLKKKAADPEKWNAALEADDDLRRAIEMILGVE